MPFRTNAAAAISIIEQHELMNEFVLVGRDLLAKIAQSRVSHPFLHVTKNLIVGPVFLDNIYDVMDKARLSDAFRDRARRCFPLWQEASLAPITGNAVQRGPFSSFS